MRNDILVRLKEKLLEAFYKAVSSLVPEEFERMVSALRESPDLINALADYIVAQTLFPERILNAVDHCILNIDAENGSSRMKGFIFEVLEIYARRIANDGKFNHGLDDFGLKLSS